MVRAEIMYPFVYAYQKASGDLYQHLRWHPKKRDKSLNPKYSYAIEQIFLNALRDRKFRFEDL